MAQPGESRATLLPPHFHSVVPAAAEAPAISLYLDLTKEGDGMGAYQRFCRRAFADQLNAWVDQPVAQRLLARGFDRIEAYLSTATGATARALAVFWAPVHGHDGIFAAVELDVPFDEHWLFVGQALHLAPLEALLAPSTRYAAVLLDEDAARIVVFGRGAESPRHATPPIGDAWPATPWSHTCYQHRGGTVHHIGALVAALERIVTGEGVPRFVVVGEASLVARVKAALPPALAAMLTDARGIASAIAPEHRYSIHDQRAASASRRGSTGSPHPSSHDDRLAATLWLRA